MKLEMLNDLLASQNQADVKFISRKLDIWQEIYDSGSHEWTTFKLLTELEVLIRDIDKNRENIRRTKKARDRQIKIDKFMKIFIRN